MTKEELITNIDRLITTTSQSPGGGLAQSIEFLKNYIGKDNSFLKTLEKINPFGHNSGISVEVSTILKALKGYVENDLLRKISLEREIQIETVSDYLEQAESLLNDKGVHPAAAAVLIGASLEEFLRNWLEDLEFDISTIKNSLDAYTQELKKLNKISKQDLKDITSWGGTRNDAAHGHWENVNDRQRIKLMLEGVNLFMRKYSEG
ncbi:hypothetical protein [Flavobacterium sp. S87F.05.LMB.W.Kidney.N]|uniref:hypothetical protein n=1 Tax=Flavobacterium sp. S87F.05.LMB.W.Kidney.N TaxID=1278758 RepID=UPI00106646C8|nr:hypothetical protein [Flavobacterium sp. S87F.05.LMB.W.Kidney.N]TDX09726.1 hypothetical protein EDB96_3313 [Flavobacterium sp. S87F.05.LMB.W.Kidney.N]